MLENSFPSDDLSVLIHLEAERGWPVTADIDKHFRGIFTRDVRLGLQILGEMFMCVRKENVVVVESFQVYNQKNVLYDVSSVRSIEDPHLYLAQRIQTMKVSHLG